jgi:nucleobase:cation symporter-1, NCS1 family
MSLGFTARETIPLFFFGFLICSIVITFTGRMGATYAIPFPVIVRSVFGMYGSYLTIVLRAFVAAMWTAILCLQAGDFLGNCITAIWPSFERFPNHLPESAGITSGGLLTCESHHRAEPATLTSSSLPLLVLANRIVAHAY